MKAALPVAIETHEALYHRIDIAHGFEGFKEVLEELEVDFGRHGWLCQLVVTPYLVIELDDIGLDLLLAYFG